MLCFNEKAVIGHVCFNMVVLEQIQAKFTQKLISTIPDSYLKPAYFDMGGSYHVC
jgi:hypothetical protein